MLKNLKWKMIKKKSENESKSKFLLETFFMFLWKKAITSIETFQLYKIHPYTELSLGSRML